MATLPTGTVAFLMTDMEGSTRLVARAGDAFPGLLDAHFALLGAAVAANGGTMVSTEGDSIFAVFPSARQAIGAAIAGQRSLSAHAWPESAEVRVRMGIHVGEAVFGGRDYTGIDVHRTARIMAAGHGGQILVSAAAAAVAGEMAGGGDEITFRDLGSHVLRDLPVPEHLMQLGAPGLAAEFPALRAQTTEAPTNLPNPPTRFVGRTRELREVGSLLERERLVTLTGPGGTGKTRLAIEVARAVRAEAPDGLWFVALDIVRDPALVVPTIAATVGLPEEPGRPIATVLAEHLARKRVLMILDNLEQVVGAAPDIASLLQAAPELRILASSREPLAVAAEQVYPVPPLLLPPEPGVPTAAEIAGQEAVLLFTERAMAARPDFALTDANAPAIAAICRRLDGLPLALELAAARMNLLTPEQILARLDHRLTLLSSSRRDLRDRQRTLRGAIDWSHDLLAEPERLLFREFSVFSGGADLDAVEAVVGADGRLREDVLDLSASLVDRSLLRSAREGSQSRLEMLETIREYAAERLAESGEGARAHGCHATYYRDLAEAHEGVLTDPKRDEVLDQLDRELANFRAAIAWSLLSGDYDTGFRIVNALGDFWHIRNHLLEGRRLLDQLLAAPSEGDPRLRARGLAEAGGLAGWHGDYANAFDLGRQALAAAESTGDRRLTMFANTGLGWAALFAQPEFAHERFRTALAIGRRLDERTLLVGSLQGDGLALMRLGDFAAARAQVVEAIDIARGMGEGYVNSLNLAALGFIELHEGREDLAIERFTEALRQSHAAGGYVGITVALDSLATVFLDRRDTKRAVELAAAADQLRRKMGGGPTMAVIGNEEPLERARRTMPPEAFEQAAAAGRTLTLDQIVTLATSAADNT
jgi:predicted ATPase/class 3 adenylate cyclase